MKAKDIVILLAIAGIAAMFSYGFLAAAWKPIEYSQPPSRENRERAHRKHFREQVLLSLIPLAVGATTVFFYIRLTRKRKMGPPNEENAAEDR